MSKKKQSFEERMARLEEIRESIEAEDTGIEETMQLFEEGIKLANNLEKEIETMESRIEILTNEPDADTPPVFTDFKSD